MKKTNKDGNILIEGGDKENTIKYRKCVKREIKRLKIRMSCFKDAKNIEKKEFYFAKILRTVLNLNFYSKKLNETPDWVEQNNRQTNQERAKEVFNNLKPIELWIEKTKLLYKNITTQSCLGDYIFDEKKFF